MAKMAQDSEELRGPSTTKLTWETESFRLRSRFTISRGSITEVSVVTVTLTSGPARGQGQCVPHERYDEDVESVTGAISKVAHLIEENPDRAF